MRNQALQVFLQLIKLSIKVKKILNLSEELVAMNVTELLYDHYKETFLIIKETIIQRNRFFVMVFLMMTLQFLLASSPDSISYLIIDIIQKKYEIDISNQISTIQSLLWLSLLYLTMRYYQSTIYIEKQYLYIHSIEDRISNLKHIKFDREGGNYLLNYPKMNDFIDFLYKWIFPIVYCLTIFYKIKNEIFSSGFTLLLFFDILLFLICFILTMLYMLFLHKKL